MGGRGHIELDRAVDSITVGRRHRSDLGDLADLVDSISQLGLLQPITVTPDGNLICGRRRLEALKLLGRRQVNVFVRSGISTELQRLLAEQHENSLTKPFTPREAAALYQELKVLLAEDAARRQEASRFGHDDGEGDGVANLAPPQERKSRVRAAQLVTGRKSYTTLERVTELETLAADADTPAHIRRLADAALHEIETHGKVNGEYQKVRRAQAVLDEAPTAENAAGERRTLGVRSFLLAWHDLIGWASRYDPNEIGPALSDEQWTDFEETVAATVEFAESARAARAAASGRA